MDRGNADEAERIGRDRGSEVHRRGQKGDADAGAGGGAHRTDGTADGRRGFRRRWTVGGRDAILPSTHKS